jgi:uncharacterized protein
MPAPTSYPGVYIDQVQPRGNGIMAVATSIAAFVGRSLSGPVESPVNIFNFGDFQRQFGGLAYDCPLSYAVQQFFTNGGTQAVICRLFEPGDAGRRQPWCMGQPPPCRNRHGRH